MKILKAFADGSLQLLAIHVEVAFERIKVEVIVVKQPRSVFPGAVHNQRIIEPVGQISETVVAVVVVNCDAR